MKGEISVIPNKSLRYAYDSEAKLQNRKHILKTWTIIIEDNYDK